jgi:chromatin segregation and condensation protein Rec8/ScpA/Scc1 (kleisin family)
VRTSSHALTLQEAFEGAPRLQRIGLFLATLELVRLRRVTVLQDSIEGPIELILCDDEHDALVIDSDEINRTHDAHDVHEAAASFD